MCKKELEEIKEAEHSEYESSTIDDRIQTNMHLSNIGNPSESSVLYKIPSQDKIVNQANHVKLPILYIDIKISQDNISRLVLYKNQTPFEAAEQFIQVRNTFLYAF